MSVRFNAIEALATSRALESHDTGEPSDRKAYSHHGHITYVEADMKVMTAPTMIVVCFHHPGRGMRVIMSARRLERASRLREA